MKDKVLIITYFFPPCNLTASQRIGGWSKYLNENDVFPIIVTRHWGVPIKESNDVLKASGKEIVIEKTSNAEIHYVPYKPDIRDRIYTSLYKTPFQKLSKAFSFILLCLENFSVRFIAHRHIYYEARKVLKENPDIKVVLISGKPFNLFFFGYKLRREFSIEWIADYRDDWSTSNIDSEPKGLNRIVSKLQAKSEVKWLKTAICFTSISPLYVRKIEVFVKRKGFVVLNGYDELELSNSKLKPENNKEFTITYNGSLYPTQPIEPFINAIINLIKERDYSIMVNFPGLAFDKSQEKRVKNAFKGYEDHVQITNRIPRREVIEMQLKSDLLLMISHSDTKGIPSSKLYEYIGLKKPILLFPNDSDIIEETLIETNLGLICNNEKEIISTLESLIIKKMSSDETDFSSYNSVAIEKYSRRNQTKIIASIIKNCVTNSLLHQKS